MNEPNKPKPRQNFAFDVQYFVATMFAVLLIRDFLVGTNDVREIPYSEFRQFVAADKVAEVAVGSHTLTGKLKPEGDAKEPKLFSTIRVEDQDLVRPADPEQ